MVRKYKGYSGTRIGREFYVYRYTDKKTNQVVYIGKTNCSLKARINAHKREESFAPYNCDIDFVKLSNEVETDSIEKFLINYYKPCINLKDKVPFLTESIGIGGINWEPYSTYLNGLKTNLQRKNIAKEQALKQTYIFEQLEEAFELNKRRIILPFVDVSLPMVGGDFNFNWSKKEVESTIGGYLFTILDDAKEIFELNKNEILASIWMPIVSMWDISVENSSNFFKIECALEILKSMKDFAYDGFAIEDHYEPFVNILSSRLESGIPYFEKWTEPVYISNDKIYIEWVDENHEHINEIKEEIFKDFIKFLKFEGIWDYSDNYCFT